MNIVGTNLMKARLLSLQGGAFGIVLLLLANIDVEIIGYSITFLVLPIIAVLLWPRKASMGTSLFLIFLLGLLVDLSSNGPTGLWAFVYLIVFTAFRPDLEQKEPQMRNVWMRYFIVLSVVAVSFLMMIAWFKLGYYSVSDIILGTLIPCLIFPVIFKLQRFFIFLMGLDV